jgi:hypothetical protein
MGAITLKSALWLKKTSCFTWMTAKSILSSTSFDDGIESIGRCRSKLQSTILGVNKPYDRLSSCFLSVINSSY